MRQISSKGHVMFLDGAWHYTSFGWYGTGDSVMEAYSDWWNRRNDMYNDAYKNTGYAPPGFQLMSLTDLLGL